MTALFCSRSLLLFVALAFIPTIETGNKAIAVSFATAVPELPASRFLALALIIALGSFVSGLAGFGFSAVGALMLWIMPAQEVIPVLMGLSLVNQTVSTLGIRKSQQLSCTPKNWFSKPHAIYSIGGIAGLPVGLHLLQSIPADVLSRLIGGVLLSYSTYGLMATSSAREHRTTMAVRAFVGFTGGVIGGFTAFPSAAIVVWSTLQGQGKQHLREIIQPFILLTQSVSLLILALYSNLINIQTLFLILVFIPLVIPFTRMGLYVYQKLSETNFKKVVMTVLLGCSVSLFIKGLT